MSEKIHPLKAMFDGMNAEWQRKRSETQMTLGKLIERLEAMPPETMIDGFQEPHSYRGYYSDLAFERSEQRITASKALEICKPCMGEVFEGYKGGDFQMGRITPIWMACYGSCGEKIMALRDDGTFELAEDKYE